MIKADIPQDVTEYKEQFFFGMNSRQLNCSVLMIVVAVFVFLVLGSIGLPVFSGKAGLHVITAGPTGGFLIGYFLSAIVGGLILAIFLNKKTEHSNARQYIFIAIAAVAATVVAFTCGIIGFMHVTHKTLAESFLMVVVPFIPGNLIKIAVMIPLAKKFRKTVQLA